MYPRGIRNELPRPQGGVSTPPTMIPNGNRGMRGPRPPPGGAEAQRNMIVEKIIADCYSKRFRDPSGRVVVDTAYQTHISIKEYSSFASEPPPANLPPNQVGNVKNRILVLCVRHSGRVLLQKGKFNEAKNVYQIGRTWDLDELRTVTRVGPSGIVLSLNKEYYWFVNEGPDRTWKFLRYLTNAYGEFMGRYPELKGISLAELKLGPVQRKPSVVQSFTGRNAATDRQGSSPNLTRSLPRDNPAPNKIPSLKNNSIPTQGPNKKTDPSSEEKNLYKNIDFTVNGKLPMKPMKVMDVDRPKMMNQNIGEDEQEGDVLSDEFVENYITIDDNDNDNKAEPAKRNTGSHPYHRNTGSFAKTPTMPNQQPEKKEENDRDDLHSFVFKNNDTTYSPEKLHEYAMGHGGGAESPLRKYKPQKDVSGHDTSDSLEPVAALGLELENQLKDLTSGKLLNDLADTSKSFNEESTKLDINSPDFGIEEVEEDAEEERSDPEPVRGLAITQNGTELANKVEAAKSREKEGRTLDTSIQDIEQYMDSQLHFNDDGQKDEPNAEDSGIQGEDREILPDDSFASKDESQSIRSLSVNEASNLSQEKSSFIDDYSVDMVYEKDPEVDEILEEVNWNIMDQSGDFLKKLTKELNNVKYLNVKELVTLDFDKDILRRDIDSSLSEIDNLSYIFKKMEIDFKFLENDIKTIEKNSKGLQVKSVNKKLLYNDLRDILSQVSMKRDDLMIIESFKDFDSPDRLVKLENKLLRLYKALGTLRQDTSENINLSSMKALRDYQVSYGNVTERFVKHFRQFFENEIRILVEEHSAHLDRFHPFVLFRSLNELLIYSSLTYFIKDVSPYVFQEINNYFNQTMGDLLERWLLFKIKTIGTTSTSSPHFIHDFEVGHSLKKSRTFRLSTKRDKTSHESSNKDLNGTGKGAKSGREIDDTQLVVQLINESKELIYYTQYFIGKTFHYDPNAMDYMEYLELNPMESRKVEFDDYSFSSFDTKTYTNDLITNLNSIFGRYINIFMKKVTPTEHSVPVLMSVLGKVLSESEKPNQEFLAYNFLRKVAEKFQSIWNKFIKNQIDMVHKSFIVAKGGILPVVKSIGQLVLITESSLDQPSRTMNEEEKQHIRQFVDESYLKLTEALVHLFSKNDPLLKNHDLDDKDREHRNVSILQNVFYLKEQIHPFEAKAITDMKNSLDLVYHDALTAYFDKILHKSIGKLIEFITNYEALTRMNNTKPKKYNKKYVKTLLTGYTHKDLAFKVSEMHKKLQKHFITGNDMFEKELLDNLWKELENQYVDYFTRLNNILRYNFDKDIEFSVSLQEIHLIFSSTH